MSQFTDELKRRELNNPDGLSRRLLDLIQSEGFGDKTLLDVGCGWGRLTLALAPRARRLIGIDRDGSAIARAWKFAEEAAIDNVEFKVADAESIDYRGLGAFDMVVANLCMSDTIIGRSSRALDAGHCLAFACFHMDQWKETEKISSFAYDPARLGEVLDANDFRVEQMEVERDVVEFISMDEAIWAIEGMKPKWQADGRWATFMTYLKQGGRQLTRSHLIVKARKR